MFGVHKYRRNCHTYQLKRLDTVRNVNGRENKAYGWSETDTHILFVYNLGENVDEAKLVTFPKLEFVTREVTAAESRGFESSRNKNYKIFYQMPSQI